MGKRASREFLTAEFSPKNAFSLDSVVPGSTKIAIWVCGEGHEWRTAVRKVVQGGQRCPYCQNKRCLSGFNDLESQRPELIRYYNSKRNPPASTIQATSNKNVWWICEKGHEWEGRPFMVDLVRGAICPECRAEERSIAIRSPKLIPWLVDKTQSALWASSRESIDLICPIGHRFQESPGVLKNSPKCPYCSGARVLSGFNDLRTFHPELISQWADENPIETVSRQSKLNAQWQCDICGYRWKAFVYNRANGYGACFKCFQKSGSKAQREVSDFVEELGFTPRLNTKSVLPRKLELDIYIPELRIAIEYNGLYWHSTERNNEKTRHFEKWQECEKLGIQLLVVWEDEWRDRRELVKRMLASKLQKSLEPKVFARNTTVVSLTDFEAQAFLDSNYLSGFSQGRAYGLKNEDGSLVAVLVVKNSETKSGHLEVARYATSCNVEDGFSKLLSNVKRTDSPRGIIAFSNNSTGEEDLYRNSGFVCEGSIESDYSYVLRGRRNQKSDFGLKNLEDLEKLHGLPRVYDYGKKRWALS